MSCDDCSGSGTCRGDHGSFDTNSKANSITGDASCEPDNTWELELGVNPISGSTETYDEVEGSFKHIFLNNFFLNTPNDQIESSCEDQLGNYRASPTNVEYYIRHPSSETTAEYKFADPRPDDNGNYEGWIMDTILDIVAGVSSSTYVGVGAALINDYIGSTSQSSVEHHAYNPDPDREIIHWDLDYATAENFPISACDSTGVRFDLEPGVNSGDHGLNTWTRSTFTSVEYVDGYECLCDADFITGYSYTTDWVMNSVTFTFNT